MLQLLLLVEESMCYSFYVRTTATQKGISSKKGLNKGICTREDPRPLSLIGMNWGEGSRCSEVYYLIVFECVNILTSVHPVFLVRFSSVPQFNIQGNVTAQQININNCITTEVAEISSIVMHSRWSA